MISSELYMYCFSRYGDHRDLHELTHSFPSRRSSDLSEPRRPPSTGLSRLPSSITVTPGAATRCPMRPEKALVPLRLKSPSSPWPTASWSSTPGHPGPSSRSEEHTSELQSLMRISYAGFCLKKKRKQSNQRILT